MTDSILLNRDGAVATVTLNRPEKRNALDAASWTRIGDVFEELSADTDMRCIVVTGAGDKAFGSGNDISEFETLRADSEQVLPYNDNATRTVLAIENSLHPTVARIQGYCMGGGLEIALCCDIRVAAADSKFGLPVKNMGIYLDPALADTLVRAVGRATALEMVLEGRILDAEEALSLGIINRLVETDELDAEIAATVERILAGAPLAQRYNRMAIRNVERATPITDEDRLRAASYADSEDYNNAWTSFMAKRKSEFKGR
jgi:enoyl-CoA hydratase/carnithine racemase